jgi:hypothetical protein
MATLEYLARPAVYSNLTKSDVLGRHVSLIPLLWFVI